MNRDYFIIICFPLDDEMTVTFFTIYNREISIWSKSHLWIWTMLEIVMHTARTIFFITSKDDTNLHLLFKIKFINNLSSIISGN